MDYDASRIVVLEGLDAVRYRPEVYLRGAPAEALAQVMVGAMCIALEAVALGRATGIRLTVDGPLAFTVRDDGRLPLLLEPAPGGDETWGERVMTLLHAGCRALKDDALEHLCEVPLALPNAVSLHGRLAVAVEGRRHLLRYADGRRVHPFEDDGPADADGVSLSFELDPAFFPGTRIGEEVVAAVLAEAARLVPCARIRVDGGARSGLPRA